MSAGLSLVLVVTLSAQEVVSVAPAPAAQPAAVQPVAAQPVAAQPAGVQPAPVVQPAPARPAPVVRPVAGYPAQPQAPSRPLASSPSSRTNLEQRTGLDLEGTWESYTENARPQETFEEYTFRRYRKKQGVGIGLALGGGALAGLGLGLLFVSEARTDASAGAQLADGLGAFFLTAAGLSMVIPGSILWAINARRLHKLRSASLGRGRFGLAFAPGGVRLSF